MNRLVDGYDLPVSVEYPSALKDGLKFDKIDKDMVLVFISTHASGPNYQGCIVLYDELEFDIQSELKNLRRAMDDVSNRLNSHPIPLIVFSQVC